MTETSKPFKVAVVGGGLAGLGVTKGLNRAGKNVQVTVYERREEDSTFSRYPIRMGLEGRKALQQLLSPEEYSQLLDLSDHGLTHGGISIFTEKLSHLMTIKKYENENPQFVHRWVLSQLLSEGIEVRKNKRVVRVRDVEGEKVEVVFADATVERVDLVVGADGVGSILRSQLYADHARVPMMDYLVVQFKLLTPLTKLPHLRPDGVNMITGRTSYSCILTTFKGKPVPPMPQVEINPFTDQFEPTLTVLNEEACPEYIFCAFSMKSFQGWEDLTPQSWIEKISKMLRDDDAEETLVRAFLQDTVPQTFGAWQIVSMDAKDMITWNGGRCVLIGDAAHAMPPQGGIGGSVALYDAANLVNTIISATELGGDAGPIDTLLPGFHQDMMTRSSAFITDAKRRLALSHKEGFGVFWQRLMLRVMNLIHPFAIWVLSRGRSGLAVAESEHKKTK